ncbi:MAG TPA: stage V sporulation protein AC [Symbiobacteriaceae bacterium]|jgi:stage V sporulation protein AC
MIKKKDLEKALATMETLEGNYLTFASSTQDKQAQSMYQTMAKDATRHVDKLNQKLQQMVYSEQVAKAEPKPPRLRNALAAFFIGGFVCLVGEGFTDLWEVVMRVSHKKAGDPTVVTLIFLAAVATGLGWFDKLQRVAGAGLSVPVTGFANAMTACAMEFKREGLVYGVGSKMFQLTGAVIVFGVVTAMLVGVVASLRLALLR